MVGLERGWRDRELPDGGRVAGLRTFALIGLLGGVLAVLPGAAVLLAAGLVALAVLLAAAYGRESSAHGSASITTNLAVLATFGLGALAGSGQPVLAIAASVVIAVVLGLKETLHGWLRRIEPAEINAMLQLGVVSAVVLPLLPDQGYGPYAALNPFKLWLAVILVGGLSLAGHVAMRWRGAEQGLLWTGLVGGLASSTAATLALARVARARPKLAPAATSASLASSAVMFLRMAAIVVVLRQGAAAALAALLVVLGVLAFAAAALSRPRERSDPQAGAGLGGRLFDLPMALGFGAILAVVAVASRTAIEHFGQTGLFVVAFASGLADVDAIVIATAQLWGDAVAPPTAGAAILVAVAANLLLKAVMAWAVGGSLMGRRLAVAHACVAAAGGVLAGAFITFS